MSAYLFIRSKRRVRDMHEKLALSALANSNDSKAIQRQLEAWAKELE